MFALDGDTLYSAVDRKPKRSSKLRRIENARARPDVTVIIDHYEENWGCLWWIRLRGRARVSRRGWFVFAVGTQQTGSECGDLLLERGAGEAFVGDHDLTAVEHALEQLCCQDTLGRVGWRELEADREPIGRAEQVETETPEPAAMRAAVAVAAVTSQG